MHQKLFAPQQDKSIGTYERTTQSTNSILVQLDKVKLDIDAEMAERAAPKEITPITRSNYAFVAEVEDSLSGKQQQAEKSSAPSTGVQAGSIISTLFALLALSAINKHYFDFSIHLCKVA
jgi:hypothetical protein